MPNKPKPKKNVKCDIDLPEDVSILEVNIPKDKYPAFFETLGNRLFVFFKPKEIKILIK